MARDMMRRGRLRLRATCCALLGAAAMPGAACLRPACGGDLAYLPSAGAASSRRIAPAGQFLFGAKLRGREHARVSSRRRLARPSISAASALGAAAAAAAVAAGTSVVVAGATGRAGRAVVEALRRRQEVKVVALVRDGAKARERLGTEGLTIVEADFADAAALASAFESCDILASKPWRLFLVCGNVPDQARLERNVLDASEGSGCEYVVKVSTVRTVLEAKKGGPYAAHLEVERALGASALQHTVLRPNVFMEMLCSGVLGIGHLLKDSDACSHPFATTPISLVDGRDVASVAAALLTAEDLSVYDGKALDLTGPAAVSYRDVAAAVSELRPRPVACEPSAMESLTVPMGLPPGISDGIQAFFTIISETAFVTDTVRQVAAVPPRTIADFVRDNAAAFLPARFSRLVAKSQGSSFRAEAAVVSGDTAEALAALGPKELFVKVLTAGVNGGADTFSVTRAEEGASDFPLGNEGVGLVVAAGGEVDDLRLGDRVAFIGAAYAEYAAVRASMCFRVPPGAAPQEVTALRISGLTALVALERTAGVKAGDVVLVTAACGATGSFAVQVAKLAGATVVGTVGSEDKAKVARDLGCDRVVNYKTEDLSAVLRDEFPEGIDIAYEGVGGELFRAAHDNLAEGGRILLVGAISTYPHNPRPSEHGVPGVPSLMEVFRAGETLDLGGGRQLVGNIWGDAFATGALGPAKARLFELYSAGKVRSLVDGRPFVGVGSIPDAVDYMLSGASVGKVWVQCCM